MYKTLRQQIHFSKLNKEFCKKQPYMEKRTLKKLKAFKLTYDGYKEYTYKDVVKEQRNARKRGLIKLTNKRVD